MQANSIMNSDRITKLKATKGGDFTEHKSILEKALAGKTCSSLKRGGGMNTTGRPAYFLPFQSNKLSDLMNTLSKCQDDIENCAVPLTR